MAKRISKYVSYWEAVKSRTASKHGIDNTPNDTQLENMKRVASSIFDYVREKVGGPLFVSSFFRSKALNEKLSGASSTSQHMNGEAIDIDADVFGYGSNRQVFKTILKDLEFDQLIWEHGDEISDVGNPAWVHVSLDAEGKNRREVLRAYRKPNGRKTYYEKLDATKTLEKI